MMRPCVEEIFSVIESLSLPWLGGAGARGRQAERGSLSSSSNHRAETSRGRFDQAIYPEMKRGIDPEKQTSR